MNLLLLGDDKNNVKIELKMQKLHKKIMKHAKKNPIEEPEDFDEFMEFQKEIYKKEWGTILND